MAVWHSRERIPHAVETTSQVRLLEVTQFEVNGEVAVDGYPAESSRTRLASTKDRVVIGLPGLISHIPRKPVCVCRSLETNALRNDATAAPPLL